MQQPLNYQYPHIYWVDSDSSSPWASSESVFCPSSVPGRPGQRRPPPLPPSTLPPPLPPPLQPAPPPLLPGPPPLLPRLPPPPLKKKRDHNTGLCLLVMFFMVLVALVGLGVEMFQLFHLQKELADLRQSSIQRSTPSLDKQVGDRSPPSEKLEQRKVAHLTGKPDSRSIPLEWEDTYGVALVSGVKHKKDSLVINDTGLYFVYSKVYFRGQYCNNQPLNHKVYVRNSIYPWDLVLMDEKMMDYCTNGQMWARSSYLGAVFNLTNADHLYVNVSALSLVNFEESKTFFGLYKL